MIGMRTPASRPISAAYMPPQLTTISASDAPLVGAHAVTRPRCTSMPVTLVCWWIRTPPARAPAASE